MWVSGLVFGVAFAAAAWAKAVGTGPSWILNGSVKYHFITDSLNAPVDWGLRLAGHPQLAVLASLGTVVAEALVITAAFSRNGGYWLGLGAVALGMLAGFGLFMGVFWYRWWILLLGFLPWARFRTGLRRDAPEMRTQGIQDTSCFAHRDAALRRTAGGNRVRAGAAARRVVDTDRTCTDVHLLPNVPRPPTPALPNLTQR